MTEIVIHAQPVTLVRLNRGSLRPLQDRTEYTCDGPDGKSYKNTNKAELTGLLRRRYGRDVQITIQSDGTAR